MDRMLLQKWCCIVQQILITDSTGGRSPTGREAGREAPRRSPR